MTSHSLELPDITLNTFYINSSHHPNTPITSSVPVDTASPSLLGLYPLSTCEKNSRTECYTAIYINPKTCGTEEKEEKEEEEEEEIAYILKCAENQKPSLVYRTKNHELKPISTGPISRGSQSGVSW